MNFRYQTTILSPAGARLDKPTFPHLWPCGRRLSNWLRGRRDGRRRVARLKSRLPIPYSTVSTSRNNSRAGCASCNMSSRDPSSLIPQVIRHDWMQLIVSNGGSPIFKSCSGHAPAIQCCARSVDQSPESRLCRDFEGWALPTMERVLMVRPTGKNLPLAVDHHQGRSTKVSALTMIVRRCPLPASRKTLGTRALKRVSEFRKSL